ncbi:AT-rich interactive domain-containing protein 2-like [Phoenix dactylifera]|uniref:AT-rich interactive domain-containing protein 2-like n=1 Tax=Phoenix dactylifera TaxID=42345 RepID=A0A8B7C8Z9_PHODC|nr:AT-rich interactive domain-containing protein 2-like [Phoenix dactylifera]
MAGWSLSSESLSLDVVEILRKLQSVGFCRHLDFPVKELSREKRGTLFYQMLSVFLKEIYRRCEIRPLPATLGDGRPVDLFELFSVVHEKGGYRSVTKSQQWAAVSEAIGLDPRVVSLLKLIYIKYLDALDQWIWIVSEKNSVKKSKAMVRGLLCEVPDQKEEFLSAPPSNSKKDQFLTPARGNECRVLLGGSVCDNGGMLVEDMGVVNGRFSHLKRKRETLVGMLNWLKKLAKDPGDPSIEKLFLKDRAKSKEAHALNKLYAQVLLARQAMFIKKIRCMSSNGPLMQKGQKVHPSFYEDSIDDNSQSREKINCSQRLQAVNKQYTPGFSSDTSTNPDDDMDEKGFVAVGGENNDIKRRLRNPSLMLDAIADLLSIDRLQKQRVPVDPSFQANVPDWTGKPYETSCDPETLKWLGTRIWPPENQERRLSFSQNPIGEGRKDTCLCERPGSVECVRFHVAEKRLQLKCELGPVFYAWRFNRMGEEVSLSWTEEEERKFKDIVRLNPLCLAKNFWDQLYRCFPFKGRKNLVSYYFNVFLLGRRSYQNRMTPNSIDSDNEETEIGLLSNRFGHDAVKVRYPESIVCSLNAQCVDLDDDMDAN